MGISRIWCCTYETTLPTQSLVCSMNTRVIGWVLNNTLTCMYVDWCASWLPLCNVFKVPSHVLVSMEYIVVLWWQHAYLSSEWNATLAPISMSLFVYLVPNKHYVDVIVTHLRLTLSPSIPNLVGDGNNKLKRQNSHQSPFRIILTMGRAIFVCLWPMFIARWINVVPFHSMHNKTYKNPKKMNACKHVKPLCMWLL